MVEEIEEFGDLCTPREDSAQGCPAPRQCLEAEVGAEAGVGLLVLVDLHDGQL